MPRMTKAEKDEIARATDKERGALALVLTDIVKGVQPTVSVTHTDRDGGLTTARFSLYRATGAAGGLVLVETLYLGKTSQVGVVYLDDLIAITTDNVYQREAINKLEHARNIAVGEKDMAKLVAFCDGKA